MIISGGLSKFSDIIKNNIELGLFNNRVVPIFKYKGEYIKVVSTANNTVKGTLEEVIDEVIYYLRDDTDFEVKYLITRSKGYTQKKTNKIKEINEVNINKVSLLWEDNGEIYIWSPTLIDILTLLKSGDVVGEGVEQTRLEIVRRINEGLSLTKDVDIRQIIDSCMPIVKYTYFHYQDFNVHIPNYVFYSLIKHIMISEDIRYCGTGQSGRYLLQLAIYDYVKKGDSLQNVKQKYNINF